MKLYARDIKGGIKEWSIGLLESSNDLVIHSGKLNGALIKTIISCTDPNKELASRVAKKRKEGYVSLKDTGYNDKEVNREEFNLGGWLTANLPKYNTDANDNLKPMKCQKFKERTMTYPVLAQPKLNGLRAVLRWETWIEGEGLFAQTIEGAKLRTKEGLEYVMPHITDGLTKELFEHPIIGELVFDGELYKHGMSLNQIKASCPMTNSRGTVSTSSRDPKQIEFHAFDLAIPDVVQWIRLDNMQVSKIDDNDSLKLVKYTRLYSDEEAIMFRDEMIRLGYEGSVLRDPNAEYAFGFRPSFIRKFKTHMDSEFLILDIRPKPSDATLPIFVLQNDITTDEFECIPIGTFDEQREYLLNKENYIGKYATVRYRERTGTEKKLPFHGNVIDIRNTK